MPSGRAEEAEEEEEEEAAEEEEEEDEDKKKKTKKKKKKKIDLPERLGAWLLEGAAAGRSAHRAELQLQI